MENLDFPSQSISFEFFDGVLAGLDGQGGDQPPLDLLSIVRGTPASQSAPPTDHPAQRRWAGVRVQSALSWSVAQGDRHRVAEARKPWQNGVMESFNGRFRDECLRLQIAARSEVTVIIGSWRQHYNAARSQWSPRYLTPNEFATQTIAAPREAADFCGIGDRAPRLVAKPAPPGKMQQTMPTGSKAGGQSTVNRLVK